MRQQTDSMKQVQQRGEAAPWTPLSCCYLSDNCTIACSLGVVRRQLL